jgi:hypothetical protein
MEGRQERFWAGFLILAFAMPLSLLIGAALEADVGAVIVLWMLLSLIGGTIAGRTFQVLFNDHVGLIQAISSAEIVADSEKGKKDQDQAKSDKPLESKGEDGDAGAKAKPLDEGASPKVPEDPKKPEPVVVGRPVSDMKQGGGAAVLPFCHVCGDLIAREPRYCGRCGASHHPDCFDVNHGCGVDGCKGHQQ